MLMWLMKWRALSMSRGRYIEYRIGFGLDRGDGVVRALELDHVSTDFCIVIPKR